MSFSIPEVSILFLDYNKSAESKVALSSIKKYAKFPHNLIYLSNGGRQDYVWDFYKEGIIDRLILQKDNSGLGFGTESLFHSNESKYSIYYQNDQVLSREIDYREIEELTRHLDKNNQIGAIGLAGLVGGYNVFSERLFLMNTALYNSIPKTHGGCGPFNHLKYNEQCVQEYFKEKGLSFPVLTNPWAADRGIWTIRELPCGGIVRMRTDTKAVYWDKLPQRSYVFPEMNDAEWSLSIQGLWKDGVIPQKYLDKGESFNCWDALIR